MANELMEFGDDLDLYVEGLNRLTVYRRNVPGQVWRTLMISVQILREQAWRGYQHLHAARLRCIISWPEPGLD